MPQSPDRASRAHVIAHIPSWPALPDLETTSTKLTFHSEFAAIIGRNGIGKTRLLRFLVGLENWRGAEVTWHSPIGYLQQTMIPPKLVSIAEHLGLARALSALAALNEGNGSEDDLVALNDRWTLEEDVRAALSLVGLGECDLERPVSTLSGGEFTRIELVRLQFSAAEFLLLDEPTNHLDKSAREYVLGFLSKWESGVLVVTHDRQLLRQADRIIELTSRGMTSYRGNYDDFLVHKDLARSAAQRRVEDADKRVRQIRQEAQQTREKAARRAQTGKKMRRDGSHGKMLLDKKKAQAEVSAGKRLQQTESSLNDASKELVQAKEQIERFRGLTFDIPTSGTKAGQGLLRLENVSFRFTKSERSLLRDVSLVLRAGDKIAVTGNNGCGKSTLLNLIAQRSDKCPGELCGSMIFSAEHIAHLDQQTEIIEGADTVFDAFQRLNPKAEPRQVHSALARFLFRGDDAFKRIKHLSGGERLRAALAGLLYAPEPPQLLLLDEPNNHLDLDSQRAVAGALRAYDGGLLMVSHDEAFLEEVGVTERLEL